MSQWEGLHPIYEMENKIPVWNHHSTRNVDVINRQIGISPTNVISEIWGLPSGKHSHGYWKWLFMDDLPIKHGDFP